MAWTHEAVLATVTKVVEEHAEPGTVITEKTELVADLGIDSLGVMEVVADIEDEFGLTIAEGELRRDGSNVVPGEDGREWLQFLSGTLRNFLEAYVVAARSLQALLKGPLDRKELLVRALRQGERMFLQGEIERSEAVSRPLLDNAFSAFVDQGYLTKRIDELALADSFASEGGLRTIEGRITAYLR